MLFKADLHPGIRDGSVTLAFRCWKRPTVRTGGTLQTPAGLLAIDTVEIIEPESITDDDARRAGAADAAEVRRQLRIDDGRQTYRISFHRLGDDPRLALREDVPDAQARAELRTQLEQLDARSPAGPWTTAVLEAIHDHPGTLAAELASRLGTSKDVFKRRVRRLKALGLTESLDIGYRLSPRGQSFLDANQ